jgi:hypothetical protein
MSNLKVLSVLLLEIFLLTAFELPVFAVKYNPGVMTGEYVEYGNFVEVGAVGPYQNHEWARLDVVAVSGKDVSLLTTGQLNNGDPIAYNGSVKVWNVETGLADGYLIIDHPVIAGNLYANDLIPPLGTRAINTTENRVYVGVSRRVNVLIFTTSSDSYDNTVTFIYDGLSGMLLEWSQKSQPKSELPLIESSYSVIETNIFSWIATPTPVPSATPSTSQLTSSPTQTDGPIVSGGASSEYVVVAVAGIAIVAVAIVLVLKRRAK